ncbi:hypothetical protein D3C84_1044970 [compost metagenome]
MQRARVVGLVHADRRRVVVDGDVHRAAKAHLEAGAGATAAGEEVDVDLFVDLVKGQAVLGAEGERGGLLQ